MCGIVGVIEKKHSVDAQIISSMLKKIQHRGPDAEGCYFSNTIAFGHRLLSIIGDPIHGKQPFYFKEDLVLVFNGTIFNYLELKKELLSHGYQFTTNTDTEVLLASYHFWGEECVHKFNGMWAFAIHDKPKNRIFCSRDRLGIKPFYYFFNGERFIFASEIKSILEAENIQKANLQAVLQFLETNFTDYNDETFFHGVKKILPAHNLIIHLDSFTISIEKYYDIKLNKEISELSLEDSIKLFEEKFNQSIEYRTRSSVDIGAALSGGLDSAYIAALSSEKLKNKGEELSLFTIGSLEPVIDEIPNAEKVSRFLGVPHIKSYPDKAEFEEVLLEVIKAHEEPFLGISVFMQYFLMKSMKQHNKIVALDGQGADELLLGYPRYAAAFAMTHPFLQTVAFLLKFRSHYGTATHIGILHVIYFSSFFFRKLYLKFRGSYLKRKYKKLIDYSHIKKLSSSYRNIFELQKNEIFWSQIPQLLKYVDINSMYHSIESRVPFLDHEFVEICLSINSNYKIKEGWSKYILRLALKGKVPEEIIWNKKKIGFEAPYKLWWPHSEDIMDTINNSNIIKKLFKKPFKEIKDTELKWRLYNLAVWESTYNMHIA